ncbi:MAG: hypothetical protein R3Y32_01300 [Bacillota bacterium]
MLKCYKCGMEVETAKMRVCPECGCIACEDCTSDDICNYCICDLTYIH